jgi:hypothetical protein
MKRWIPVIAFVGAAALIATALWLRQPGPQLEKPATASARHEPPAAPQRAP